MSETDKGPEGGTDERQRLIQNLLCLITQDSAVKERKQDGLCLARWIHFPPRSIALSVFLSVLSDPDGGNVRLSLSPGDTAPPPIRFSLGATDHTAVRQQGPGVQEEVTTPVESETSQWQHLRTYSNKPWGSFSKSARMLIATNAH